VNIRSSCPNDCLVGVLAYELRHAYEVAHAAGDVVVDGSLREFFARLGDTGKRSGPTARQLWCTRRTQRRIRYTRCFTRSARIRRLDRVPLEPDLSEFQKILSDVTDPLSGVDDR
jgi:hypothetical protein